MRTVTEGKKGLETRVQELEVENAKLKKENESLSSQMATVQLVLADMNENGGAK